MGRRKEGRGEERQEKGEGREEKGRGNEVCIGDRYVSRECRMYGMG